MYAYWLLETQLLEHDVLFRVSNSRVTTASSRPAVKVVIVRLTSATTRLRGTTRLPPNHPNPRAYLEHNTKTLATTERELDLATILAEEKASLAVQSLHEEEKGLDKLGSREVCTMYHSFPRSRRASRPQIPLYRLLYLGPRKTTTTGGGGEALSPVQVAATMLGDLFR